MTAARGIFHFSIFLLLGCILLLGLTTGTGTTGFWIFDFYSPLPDPGIWLILFMAGVIGASIGGLSKKENQKVFGFSLLMENKNLLLGYGLLLKIVWLFLIWFSGFTVLSSDDLCRLIFSHQWSRQPFFATWDFVWLAGQFYLYGLGEWLGMDPLVAARFFGILAGLGVVILGYGISLHLFGKKTALFTLLVLIFEPHLNWITLAPLPGIYFTLGILWTAYSLIRWHRSFWGWFFSSFGLLFASTMRHEAISWILIFWAILSVYSWFRWKELKTWEWVLGIFSAFIPVIYFFFWFYFCAREHGSPFHFMARIAEFTYEFRYLTTSGYRVFYYGNLLFQTTPFIALFGLIGLFYSFRKKETPVIKFYAGALILFAVGMEISVLRGAAATNLPWRTFLTPVVLLIPFAVNMGVKFWNGADSNNNVKKFKKAFCSLLGVFILLMFGFQSFAYPLHRGMTPEVMDAAVFLRTLTPQIPENVTTIGTWMINNPADLWALQFYGRDPDEIIDFSKFSQTELNDWKNSNPGGILISKGLFPEGSGKIFESGSVKIYSWVSSQ